MTLSSYFRTADDQQHLMWIAGATLNIMLDSAASNGSLLIMQIDSIYGEAAPVHVHANEDEVFLVLEGSLIVWVGEERRELGPGELAFLPRDLPHTYFVNSETAKIHFLATPGGLEQAFREAGWDLSASVPEGWACTPQAITDAMAKVGCQILGPPKGADDGPITAR